MPNSTPVQQTNTSGPPQAVTSLNSRRQTKKKIQRITLYCKISIAEIPHRQLRSSLHRTQILRDFLERTFHVIVHKTDTLIKKAHKPSQSGLSP